MLVLTRKPGQSIMIGDDIEVQVLSVAGDKVRLGITAPREVGIFRDEVYERIERDREADRDPAQVPAPANGNGSAPENGTASRAPFERVPFEG